MSELEQGVSLVTLKRGVAVEAVDDQLAAIVANIADPNTNARAARSVTLTITFKPSADRESAEIDIACRAKLAPPQSTKSLVYIGRQGPRHIAVEHDPRHVPLFQQQPASLTVVESGDRAAGGGES